MGHGGHGPHDEESPNDWEVRKKETPLFLHIIAGSIAGGFEKLVMYPADTIKTHMQSSQDAGKSFTKTSIEMYQKEGILRFYSGSTAFLYGAIIAHAGLFVTYEASKKWVGANDSKYHPLKDAFVGVLVSLTHDIIETPADVIKQRMQIAGFGSWVQGVKDILKQEGPIAFYRSLPITAIMNLPFYATFVSANESLKVFLKQRKGDGLGTYFLCSGLASTVASWTTMPFDVVKTRLQIQELESSLGKSLHHEHGHEHDHKHEHEHDCKSHEHEHAEHKNGTGKRHFGQKFFKFQCRAFHEGHHISSNVKFSNITQAAVYVYENEGITGFWRGSVPRMLYVMPGFAAAWTTYEGVKGFLSRKML